MADALDWRKTFPGTELTTTAAVILGPLTQGVIRRGSVAVCNKTAGIVMVSVFVVPTTDPPTAAGDPGTNVVVDYSIPANDTKEVLIPKLVVGDSLMASASANSSLEIFDIDMLVRA